MQDPKTTPPNPFTGYERQDDLSAVAFYYLNSPENHLPALAPVAERLQGVPEPNPK